MGSSSRTVGDEARSIRVPSQNLPARDRRVRTGFKLSSLPSRLYADAARATKDGRPQPAKGTRTPATGANNLAGM